MPDLLERLKKSDPSKLVSKDTLNDKLREKYLHNIKDINYTLKYEEPTPVMKEIASQGNYSAGNTIYANPYGSASGGGGSGGTDPLAAMGNNGGGGSSNVGSYCPNVPGDCYSAIDQIYKYNRNQTNNYDHAWQVITGYARNHPQTYTSSIKPCLATLGNYSVRGNNAATHIMNAADAIAAGSGTVKAVSNAISNAGNAIQSAGQQIYNAGVNLVNTVGQAIQGGIDWVASWFK